MSGPLSVPLAIAAYFVPNEGAKIILGITAFACAVFAAFRLWQRERSARVTAEERLGINRIEFLFDDSHTYVREMRTLHGSRGERYFVGLRNSGTSTLEGVTLRGREGWFVANTIEVAHRRRDRPSERNPLVVTPSHLDPGATELVELFGLDYSAGSTSPDDVFNRRQRFQLELRARNTPTVVADFDYDPNRRPMVRLIGIHS
jgi:hypothetical protein